MNVFFVHVSEIMLEEVEVEEVHRIQQKQNRDAVCAYMSMLHRIHTTLR